MAKTNQFRNQLKGGNGQTVQLNKGHYNLDTEERSNEFNRKMGGGWESEYAKYRLDWVSLPMEKKIREYPLLVDVELASNCNLKCPMCYTTTDHFMETVNRKLMKWDLFKKVVDEIAGKVPALRLSWRGESTLHNKFIDAVRYAKQKGMKEVSFLTNGSKLDQAYFKELVDAGADWITISFDGVGEEYDKIRAPLKYEETLKKLIDIMKYKREHNISKPMIKVQGVWPAIRKNPEKFYAAMRDASDLVAFNPLIDYLGNDSDLDIVYEENFSCPQLYQRVFISSTGDAMMCNSDEYGEEIIGNALEESVHDIWHGEKLNRIRALHSKENGFKEVPVCQKCFYPRKTEISEQVQVDGRTILIENYINRKQEIGV